MAMTSADTPASDATPGAEAPVRLLGTYPFRRILLPDECKINARTLRAAPRPTYRYDADGVRAPAVGGKRRWAAETGEPTRRGRKRAMRPEEDDVFAMIVFILLGHVAALFVGRSALHDFAQMRREGDAAVAAVEA